MFATLYLRLPTSNSLDNTNVPRLTLSGLNDDVLREILDHLSVSVTTNYSFSRPPTTLKNLSLVNHRLRNLVVQQLFQKVTICLSRAQLRDSKNGDWDTARRAITTLTSNIMVLSVIKILKFDIYGNGEPERPVSDHNMHNLVTFLTCLPNLENLSIHIPKPHIPAFQAAFRTFDSASPFIFPNIKTLVAHPLSVFLIDRCPNVERVGLQSPQWCRTTGSYDPSDVVEALRGDLKFIGKRAKHIKHFEARSRWMFYEIYDLAHAFPNLERLSMRSYGGEYCSGIGDIMTALGENFKTLRRLDIDEAGKLRLGFHGWPPCGNMFIGPQGQEAYEEYSTAEKRAENRAAELAFRNIKSLKELWVGDFAVARKVGEEAEMKWEWTTNYDMVRGEISR
ncbi:uncharacterized protein BDR25DRAFT_60385 [Lindgomyces ingoldianus]|uniref:Uncharacterized protein n=1 Tax=Lindgomyces ingoldianus TaxID=673940 RepID=A0ACB6QLS9_9PLEO|nr:uncharacterized protein BDR25DRAFT_60385 [Lindgomyces ingoldianus]KAF2467898.1 hypothetical protein BDR25DRAFT_60385 [Lindgomyces ingoldianus]